MVCRQQTFGARHRYPSSRSLLHMLRLVRRPSEKGENTLKWAEKKKARNLQHLLSLLKQKCMFEERKKRLYYMY